MPIPQGDNTWRRRDWAYLSVRLGDWPARDRRHSGVALLDGTQKGDLVGGEPRVFRVTPGTHRLSIGLGRVRNHRIRRGRVEVGDFTLKPGERVGLVCRVRPEVSRQVDVLSGRTILCELGLFAGLILSYAVSMLAFASSRPVLSAKMICLSLFILGQFMVADAEQKRAQKMLSELGGAYEVDFEPFAQEKTLIERDVLDG